MLNNVYMENDSIIVTYGAYRGKRGRLVNLVGHVFPFMWKVKIDNLNKNIVLKGNEFKSGDLKKVIS